MSTQTQALNGTEADEYCAELIHALTFSANPGKAMLANARKIPMLDILKERDIHALAAFTERVAVAESGCWEWTGYPLEKGYGMMLIDYRQYRAHRVSYALHYGVDPGRYVLMHKCDNPPCVNPLHLHLGTQKENIKDAAAKGRVANGQRHGTKKYPERYRGENGSQAKLSDARVIQIRRDYMPGVISYRAIAEREGVSRRTIQQVVRQEIWKHLPSREELLNHEQHADVD